MIIINKELVLILLVILASRPWVELYSPSQTLNTPLTTSHTSYTPSPPLSHSLSRPPTPLLFSL